MEKVLWLFIGGWTLGMIGLSMLEHICAHIHADHGRSTMPSRDTRTKTFSLPMQISLSLECSMELGVGIVRQTLYIRAWSRKWWLENGGKISKRLTSVVMAQGGDFVSLNNICNWFLTYKYNHIIWYLLMNFLLLSSCHESNNVQWVESWTSQIRGRHWSRSINYTLYWPNESWTTTSENCHSEYNATFLLI